MDRINLDAVMHVFENIIVKWHIWLADRGHLRWDDICFLISSNILRCVGLLLDVVRNTIVVIIDRNDLSTCCCLVLLLVLVCNLLSHSIVWILRHLILVGLHQVVWSHLILVHLVVAILHGCLTESTLRRARHVLRDHVSIVLVDRVVLVAIRIHINFVELMINFWFEKLLNHGPSILGSQLLSQSQQ